MSELVARTGVAAATIRYYLAVGLLPPPERVASNRHHYDERHVELVRLVRLLRERRQLGLETIATVLPDLLPDLLGRPEPGGAFRPEMWDRLLRSPLESSSAELVSARVLQAAVAAFSRQGYSEVTLDEVCKAAGIAKGSLYRHFASKEDLFFASARAAGGSVAARLTASAPAGRAAGEWDEAVLAEAVAPEVGILLDLAALAARQRPGAAEVLAEVIGALEAAACAAGSSVGSAEGAPPSRSALAASRSVSLAFGSVLLRLAASGVPSRASSPEPR